VLGPYGCKVMNIAQAAALTAALVVLAGCEFRPSPVSAYSERVGDEELVKVNLRSADALTIKNRQLYFSVVVGSCPDEASGYPAEPYIGGRRASDFQFTTANAVVEVVSRVPARVFETYSNPCAFLRGGGYFTGKIKSWPVPIQKVGGAGPNKSFKPNPLRGSA